jgi:hypothetical protein
VLDNLCLLCTRPRAGVYRSPILLTGLDSYRLLTGLDSYRHQALGVYRHNLRANVNSNNTLSHTHTMQFGHLQILTML